MKDKEALSQSPKISRRDFARRGTAAVVGGVLASHFPLSASAYYGADDTIKVGLIGCGGRGTGAATQALRARENVQLVAMADAFRDRLDDCYEKVTHPDQGVADHEAAVLAELATL